MEKDRKARLIAIAALIVGVFGLSLGFAAFSNTLTIKSSAEVTPDENILNVDCSSASGSVETNPIVASLEPTGVTGFEAKNATINNSGNPIIQNLHATFTAPNQKATYTFYTKNIGALKAYLNDINFKNVSEGSSTKVCTAKTGTTQSLVDTACNGISLKLTLGSEDFSATTTRTGFTSAAAHDLEVNGYETVKVEISYADGSAQADGDFDVSFGDIELIYGSTTN